MDKWTLIEPERSDRADMSLIKENFVAKFLGLDKTRVEKILQGYEQGVFTCVHCKSTMSFAGCTPISLLGCPNCGSLVLVPVKIGEWWVMEPIGAGGFGSVYLARSSANPELRAAVKILQKSEHIDDMVVSDFIRESEIAYSLGSHPNIMETYAVGTLDDGAHFMITEFLDGELLGDMISARGRIHPEECLYYTLDMISALEFIQKSGYVYCDMKPLNVIVKKNGLATIIDLGLCQTIEAAKNPSGKGPITGSALFVPPERCYRMPEDHRSDIYSLGMVLYHALTGESFFSRTEVRTAMRAHTMKLRIPTQSRMEGFDPAIVETVDHMIKRQPDERFQTFEETRMAVFTVLAGFQHKETTDPLLLHRRRHFLDTYGELEYE